MKIRLKDIRKKKNITQEEMAKEVGVTPAYICRVEKGTRNISLSLATDIADYLEVSLDEIAGREKIKNRKEK